MLALLFGLFVVGSLSTSGLIYFELLEASPQVLLVVMGVHGVLGFFFFKGYLDYRAVHGLVGQGRGELFSYVTVSLIGRCRTRGFADHYRARLVQGAALAGLPARALEAAENFHSMTASPSKRERLDVFAAEIAANAALGRLWWAEHKGHEARALKGAEDHRGLSMVLAHLAGLQGDRQRAAHELATGRPPRGFPFGGVMEARRRVWLAQALHGLGRSSEASDAYRRAIRVAPQSYWAEEARRGQARLGSP